MEHLQLIHTFDLDGQIFALPLQSIDQIIRAADYKLVPNLPQGIQGILNYHGDLVPVVDLRHRLGLPEKVISIEDRMVIVKTQKKRIVILVSEALNILHIDQSKTYNTSELTGNKDLEMIACIDQEVAFVYNPDHLLSQENFESFQQSFSISQQIKQTA